MLLRSASTPLLNSLVHASSPRESPIEPESVHQIQRPTRSLMLSSSCCYSPMSVHSSDESARRMKRTASESDLRHLTSTKPPARKFLSGGGGGALMEEDVEEGIGFGIIRTDGFSWGLDDTEVSGGCGGGGGVIHGGGNGDGEDGDDDSTDVHYRKMIEANPGNGIFLSNYAKFLKEVRKDYLRAEEYCGRAILTNPNDGSVLAMYAELVWTIHKDSSRAESYFVRAVAAAPDDCYVQASYARFLWDADEEEDEEEELEPQTSRMSFYTGPSPITAMS
ncbi:Tetratricopeptide repeat [Hirschfeldia incana]|nr:Tetratricopeptide repeat [Hirschfeldia incana]